MCWYVFSFVCFFRCLLLRVSMSFLSYFVLIYFAMFVVACVAEF